MEALNLKFTMQRRPISQPQGDADRGLMAGYHYSTPCLARTGNEIPVGIHDQSRYKQHQLEKESSLGSCTYAGYESVMSPMSESEDDSSPVYDLAYGINEQPSATINNLVTNVRQESLSAQDCNIVWKSNFKSGYRLVDHFEEQRSEVTEKVEEHHFGVTEKKRGYVICGNDKDVCQLVSERSVHPEETHNKGVICNSRVLCSENGNYSEGEQYAVFPNRKSDGAFGEAVMCEDKTSHKTYIRKKVNGQLSRNEVIVPLMLKGTPGVPEVYGVICNGQTTDIFQEDAGLSLRKLCESEYAARVRDPGMLLGLAFQGFATLDKLHSKGIQHLDIKPENICVDMGQKVPSLKLIDFGTSQLPGEVVTKGLTYEYLSPESCLCLLKAQTQNEGRLGPGADVWAFALSLLYGLCGYHVMIYMCTKQMAYPSDLPPHKLMEKRIESILKIYRLTDEDIVNGLIHPEWPEVLKTLLINTLRVDPNQRWSAGQAASFILDYLKTVAQRSAAPVAVASSSGFTSPPTNLCIRVQNTQNGRQSLPVQFTAIDASRAQLPVFGELLPHSVSTTEARSGKRRCEEPVRQGYKVMKM